MSSNRSSARQCTAKPLTNWKADFERIRTDEKLHIKPKDSLERMFKTKSTDIVVDVLQVSLICPLSERRIEVPARGVACRHPGCFELATFLRKKTEEDKPNWECPVRDCKALRRLQDVRIDKYFWEVCANLEADAKTVQIDADGKYRGIAPAQPDGVEQGHKESESLVSDASLNVSSA